MRYRRSSIVNCNTPTENCLEYTPDFVKLPESCGIKGIWVTDEKEIAVALETAKNNRKGLTVIEFIIDREVNVMPRVSQENTLNEMILERGRVR